MLIEQNREFSQTVKTRYPLTFQIWHSIYCVQDNETVYVIYICLFLQNNNQSAHSNKLLQEEEMSSLNEPTVTSSRSGQLKQLDNLV